MNTATLTPDQTQSIIDTLARMPNIPEGLGDAENACSIAAINLALTGELIDAIPECMSEVIGRWIIATQDAMPAAIRNGAAWRGLLPLAAGTGREKEKKRLGIVLRWMWGCLELAQPVADRDGYGGAWRIMCIDRTPDAAYAAYAAAADAYAADAYAAAADAYAADAADAYAYAYAAADAADAYTADAYAYAYAYAYAADAAAQAATYAAAATSWNHADPVGLLQKLIDA